jgi:hypothetical protein
MSYTYNQSAKNTWSGTGAVSVQTAAAITPTAGDILIGSVLFNVGSAGGSGYNMTLTDAASNTWRPTGAVGLGFGSTSTAITFATAPSSGATSAPLSATFGGTTGAYVVAFSDGEMRLVTLTNGATTCTWTSGTASFMGGALANNCTTAATAYGGENIVFGVYAAGVAATSIQPTFANSGSFTCCTGLEFEDYTASLASTTPVGFSGNFQNGPGLGSNAITSNAVSGVSGSSLMHACYWDLSTPTAGATAGTGFSALRNSFGSGGFCYAEDQQISSNIAGTFTPSSGNEFDLITTIAQVWGLSSGGSATIAWIT